LFSPRPGILAAIAITLAFSTQSLAQDFLRTGPHVFNYNYAELKYVDVDNADGYFRPVLISQVEMATVIPVYLPAVACDTP